MKLFESSDMNTINERLLFINRCVTCYSVKEERSGYVNLLSLHETLAVWHCYTLTVSLLLLTLSTRCLRKKCRTVLFLPVLQQMWNNFQLVNSEKEAGIKNTPSPVNSVAT